MIYSSMLMVSWVSNYHKSCLILDKCNLKNIILKYLINTNCYYLKVKFWSTTYIIENYNTFTNFLKILFKYYIYYTLLTFILYLQSFFFFKIVIT